VQPLLKVQLAESSGDDKFIIINENHVVTVRRHTDGHAIVIMSTGEELIISNPSFVEWEGDCYVRKQ